MLGNKIKSYRENKKMTQNEVASILSVSPATMSKYESNTLEPSIESLKKLAEIFEISVDELIKTEENTFDISKINILDILREQKDMNFKGNLYHNTQITFAYYKPYRRKSAYRRSNKIYLWNEYSINWKKHNNQFRWYIRNN